MDVDYTSSRRYRRVKVDIRVHVFAPGGRACFGRGHDISEGGVALYVPLELEVGDRIGIAFEAPLVNLRIGVHGTVRSKDGYRYGVEFYNLTGSDTAALKMLVSTLTSAAAEAPGP